MKYHHLIAAGSLISLAIPCLPSCSMFDAKPAPNSGYNRSTASTTTRAAFLQQTWVDAKYRGKAINEQFSSVYIAPVNTSYMEKQTWWQQQGERKGQIAKDSAEFAVKMRTQFNQAIVNYPGKHMALANGPGPGVLVIELALVELVPSKAYWNAGATVIPGAGLLLVAGVGSIAMEGRARDGKNNQIIATFKDRRNDKAAPVNIGSYTWYHGAETNVADWAAEFAELLNTPPGHVVKRASAVTLKPW